MRTRNIKNTLARALFLAACALAALTRASPVAAAADIEKLNLDVVLVVDCSGSMNYSDPGKLALAAANEFIDLCGGSDSRIGYVMYTHVISASQDFGDRSYIVSFQRELKNDISAMQYHSAGDTDTALGLERAAEIFAGDPSGGSDRRPVIILLSDGNTDLSSQFPGSRTTQESLAALERVKAQLQGSGIPVYTIGFNYNGNMDTQALSSISTATGAISQTATSAEQLPGILQNIYAHLAEAKEGDITTVIATGEPQVFPIDVSNESIYKTTVTVRSSQPIAGVSVADPNGAEPSQNIPDRNTMSIEADPGGTYTMISLYKPMKGQWQLTFTGTTGDTVTFAHLSVYDLTLVMDLPKTDYDGADIPWHLEESDGTVINDQDLADMVTVTLHADDGAGNIVEEAFPRGAVSNYFGLPPGTYKAYLTLDSDIIERESINIQTFTILDGPPLELYDPSEDTLKFSLWTLFSEEAAFDISDLVDYDDYNMPLKVSVPRRGGGNWSDYLEWDYDKSDESVAIKALRSGKTTLTLDVEGSDGSGVQIFVELNTKSGYLPIAGLAALVLIAAGIMILVKAGKKPFLNDPLSSFDIELNLPGAIAYELTPEAARFKLERVKAKRNLMQVIDYNTAYAESYAAALRDVSWFTHGTVFYARKPNSLEVTVPVDPQYQVRVNGRRIPSDSAFQLDARSGLRIELVRNDDMYEISIGSAASLGGGFADETEIVGRDEFRFGDSGGGGYGGYGGYGQGPGGGGYGGDPGGTEFDF
ncbi:MAG: VWA domain-containing protein [Oscillospiraceae bacterium]|jgi:Mg-chelatase subunit ChlD|nr:VWA domain-containing protein [Oscillospiraceae bacterium]